MSVTKRPLKLTFPSLQLVKVTEKKSYITRKKEMEIETFVALSLIKLQK